MEGAGFTLVEMLTMCPTGWFVSPSSGGTYSETTLACVYPLGELTVAPKPASGGHDAAAR